jgi:hypothetical protein
MTADYCCLATILYFVIALPLAMLLGKYIKKHRQAHYPYVD